MADVEKELEEAVTEGVDEDAEAVAVEEEVVAAGASEVKLFGKWDFGEIEIRDISLEVSQCRVMDFPNKLLG